MILPVLRWALLALALIPTAGQATSVAEDYTSFWVLGASHADTSNSALGPPYYQNRYSDGPIWVDYFTDRFDAAGKPHGNVARGGAAAITNGDAIPDMAAQALNYRALSAERRGTRPLVAIWFGGNDVSGASGTGTANAVATKAVQTIVDEAIGLLDTTSDFLILNLHHVDETPLFRQPHMASAQAEAHVAVDVFNAELPKQIKRLEAAGGTVTLLDVAALEDRLGEFGITNRTMPCFAGGALLCNRAQLAKSQYFDQFHPTAATHKVIGEAGLALYAQAPSPVPIPASGALMLLALALVAWRFRRVEPRI